jgi:ParB family chromosome partitioning protein
MAKPALGRGLGALLGGANPTAKPPVASAPPSSNSSSADPALAGVGEIVRRIPLAEIRPCPFQPRKEFTQEALQELADSIREQGIIQPLIVRRQRDGYELIAGERRWRAAQLLGLAEVPVLVREADDRAVLELALIENLQRENLNPMEEAQGYSELVEKFQLRQEDVARKVGRSRVTVANALRLLKLDEEIQVYVRDGRLSVGHAKALLGLASHLEQKLAAERVLKQNLNVRQAEELVARLQNVPTAGGTTGHRNGHASPIPDVHVANVENKLCERLGTKVQLRYRQGKGSIEIRYFSDDELERILEIIGVKID